MDPIDSWVDGVALRKLAESLVAPSLANEEPRESLGSDFVGFEKAGSQQEQCKVSPSRVPQSMGPPKVEHQARAALAGAKEAAERGGILGSPRINEPDADEQSSLTPPQRTVDPAEEPSPVARPITAAPARTEALTAPRGLFVDRLRAYGEWLHRSVGAKAFFVCDREGEVVIDEVNSPKLVHVARTLAQASWAASRQAGGHSAMGSLHVKLGADSVLEVLPVITRFGPLILGLVVPRLLTEATVGVVAESLQNAVNTPIQAS